ncbi:Arylsulfatase A [Mariniphaga anaerophila]|uniref:Arylsulfatase A n=1 Tax=Mariniphaga anaerophila TaxID=1484053 RepID=A0A1M4ZTL5_9BACT|nr:sulfatase [Mariniphaga anaerophila]SHF21410.1 Arylsulfatase A [Mariniphaga anaerophila]
MNMDYKRKIVMNTSTDEARGFTFLQTKASLPKLCAVKLCFDFWTLKNWKESNRPIKMSYFILSVFLFSFLFLSGCKNETNKEQHEPPNFIVFIADDAAWNDCGPYGNHNIKTPNINNLAEEGVVFFNAFLTTSSCSPSRSSILTGRYPHCTGASELHMPLPEDQLLFPGELQKAGYYTAVAGKYHIGPKRKEFDTIYGGSPSGCEYWIESLQNRPKNKPFFLWLAALDPHREYAFGTISEPHQPEDVIVPPYLPDNDSTRKDLALYYDEIARMDSYIGQVMGELKKQGIDENTLILFMSDNGSPFPRAKTRLYDSGIKTPFIVRWPKKLKNGTSDALISSIDIAPTLCELAGAGISETYQGISFLPILKNYSESVRNYIAAEHNWHDYQAHERAIRNKNYLYIRNAFPQFNASPPADAVNSMTYREMIRLYEAGELAEHHLDCFIEPRNAEELYDVKNDPYQFYNLAGNPKYEKELNGMRKLLDNWSLKFGDKIPENPTPDKFDRWTGERLSF